MFVAVAAMKADIMGHDVAALQASYQRIESLEESIQVLNGQLFKANASLAILRAQIEAEPSPMKALTDYLDAIESPAWIKVWDTEGKVFRMLHINHSYERTYGVTREFYVGQSDHDVHPVEIAKVYHENDMDAYRVKGFRRFSERVRDSDGVKRVHSFWKFYIRLPDGQEAIAGIQLD